MIFGFYVLGLLHLVYVGDAANVSNVSVTSTFTVEVCRLVSFCVYITLPKPTHFDPEDGGSMDLRKF
jgi:hypothetical protein